MAMDTSQLSRQAQELLRRATKENEEHDKKTAITGMPQNNPVRTPTTVESTEEIPSMIQANPEDTAMLHQQYNRLYDEVETLVGQPQKGILESLRGPRKWSLAMSLALNPGMRSAINHKLQRVRDERIQKRRDLMLRIGMELRNRTVDPVLVEELKAKARQVGAYEGAMEVQDRTRTKLQGLVRAGVFDEMEVFEWERMQLGFKERPGMTLRETIRKDLDMHHDIEQSFRLGEIGPADLDAAFTVYEDILGRGLTDYEKQVYTAHAKAGMDAPKGETPEAELKRKRRLAEGVYRTNVSLVRERGKEKRPYNLKDLLKANPNMTLAYAMNEKLLKYHDVYTLEPIDVHRLAHQATVALGIDPDMIPVSFDSEPPDGSPPTIKGDAEDAEAFEEWKKSQE